MKRTWTTVGEKVVGPILDEGTVLDRNEIVRAIQDLEWQKVPKNGTMTLPMGPGLGIGEVIKQCRVPKVSHIAITNQLAPYGFYGIRGHYKNGQAEVYVIDMGSELVPVCSDFHEKVSM